MTPYSTEQLLKKHENYLEEWYKKGLQGLHHYDKTGLHVTHDEVCKWLNSLKTDNPQPIPQCHQ